MDIVPPPNPQVNVHPTVRHGFPPASVVVCAAVHVPAGTSVQGCGVNTPSAAAVAACTAGFISDVHMANGGRFVLGAQSVTVATGIFPISTFVCDVTFNTLGAVPKVHMHCVPVVTYTIPTHLTSFPVPVRLLSDSMFPLGQHTVPDRNRFCSLCDTAVDRLHLLPPGLL